MTTPVKHVLIPVHVKMAAGSLLKYVDREVVVVASNYASQRKGSEATVQRPVVQHTLPDIDM